MITQKLISLKIDTNLFENFDTECQRTYRKRNWFDLEIRRVKEITSNEQQL